MFPLVQVDASVRSNGHARSTDEASSAMELREVLQDVRGECDAKAAELDARQGDLQLVRRALHSANQELASYRSRTSTMRVLLGQAVREQCREQIWVAHAIATAPPPRPPEACVPRIGDSPSSSLDRARTPPPPASPSDDDEPDGAVGDGGGGNSSVGGGGGGGGGLPSIDALLAHDVDDDDDDDDDEDWENGETRGDDADFPGPTLTAPPLGPPIAGRSPGATDRTGSAAGCDTSGDATAASLNDDADQLAGLPTLVDTPILVEADAPATAGAEAQLMSLGSVDLSAGS